MENVNSNQISDELLAAFLEGKTDSAETIRVLNAIASDSDLAELFADVYAMDEIDDIAQKVGDDIYSEFGIETLVSEQKKFKPDERFLKPEHSMIEDMFPIAALKEHNKISFTNLPIDAEFWNDIDKEKGNNEF